MQRIISGIGSIILVSAFTACSADPDDPAERSAIEGESSSAVSGPNSKGPPPASECNDCMKQKCAEEVRDCKQSADCQAGITCVISCAPDDCVDECVAAYSGAQSLYQCAATECQLACN